ncbi:DUF732 domain-containing protein [Nocardia africana]|uniref:Protein of uncharacterized function (DUF732) n=1 Tax=Nocardia africana TaxID=134964 RepID=A0A378WR80_9NOCA|nr:DUF732 domain-containing protein [Nocardia africana]MCC3314749.1 DUF732 domain-containing protein [Nocardia africana]SUA42971.1 Protein of uncharacterised function (DUF732) [Nocardia africana]
MNTAPIVSSLLAAGAITAVLTVTAPATFAAPDTGSSGSAGSSCGPRSGADNLFLSNYAEDDDTCSGQDSAIQLAQAECHWLDAYGNSAHNQIVLAEKSRGAVKYPYIFLDAAIQAYCPQYEL